MNKLKIELAITLTWALILGWFVVANAGTFAWIYKSADEAKMAYFEIFNDAGTVVVPDIDPTARTATYTVPAGNDIKIYGIRACNKLGWCSKASNLIYVIPDAPDAPVGFAIK